ncbi:MAG: hypothetical protein PQJ28_01875 [Spirochaetales bacterium]|nr:hypothetical protein [Spirochaetales bacterium]
MCVPHNLALERIRIHLFLMAGRREFKSLRCGGKKTAAAVAERILKAVTASIICLAAAAVVIAMVLRMRKGIGNGTARQRRGSQHGK